MYSVHLRESVYQSKLHRLIKLVRHTPAVRSCIQRVYNEIVPPSVMVQERGKDLTPKLQAVIGPVLAQFLEQALEMAYMCGFVVFVCKRHEGIPVPVLLPLGSFTWSVEVVTQKTKKRRREHVSLYRYNVRPLHPEVTKEDLLVFNFQEPFLDEGRVLPSPMDSLVDVHELIEFMQAKLINVIEWNSTKHIATSERVEHPKDQTTEGISLLDEFRRYLITGNHSGVNRFYMTLNGDAPPHTTDPSQLSAAHIHNSFGSLRGLEGATGDLGASSVHVLPPNTDVSELAAVDPKLNMLEIQELFQRQVIQFFHMTAQPDINQKTKRAYMEMTDIKYMRHMARFGTHLLQFTYACLFDVDEKEVFVTLEEPSALALESLDDVKNLAEMQVLLPSDKLKIRKRVMRSV